MKKSLAIFGLLSLLGCSNSEDRKGDNPSYNTQPSGHDNETPKAFLIQGTGAKVFQDISSELRCEALKDYFTEFASEGLDGGKLDNFACEDRSFRDRDDYSVKIQLTSGDRTAVLALNIFGPTLSNPHYCKPPFSDSVEVICPSTEIYYSSLDQRQQNGLIHPNMKVFRDFVSQYLAQPQTRDLALGMDARDFASAWTAKLNAGEKISTGIENKFELGLRLTHDGEDVLKGVVEITDINEDAMTQQGILGCGTKECLIGKSFPYVFNGHRLSLRNKEWYLAIPLTKP